MTATARYCTLAGRAAPESLGVDEGAELPAVLAGLESPVGVAVLELELGSEVDSLLGAFLPHLSRMLVVQAF